MEKIEEKKDYSIFCLKHFSATHIPNIKFKDKSRGGDYDTLAQTIIICENCGRDMTFTEAVKCVLKNNV